MNQILNYLRSKLQNKERKKKKEKKRQLTLFSLCIMAYRLATCPTSLLMVNNKLRARSAS